MEHLFNLFILSLFLPFIFWLLDNVAFFYFLFLTTYVPSKKLSFHVAL
jgi:hypothetical protein